MDAALLEDVNDFEQLAQRPAEPVKADHALSPGRA
jgi:hypothetical protein